MRLLQLANYSNFSFAEFANDEVAPYAIPSHTWVKDGNKVMYKDMDDTKIIKPSS